MTTTSLCLALAAAGLLAAGCKSDDQPATRPADLPVEQALIDASTSPATRQAAGDAASADAWDSPVTQERYMAFGNEWIRLNNGDVEVQIDTVTGHVMRYGPAGDGKQQSLTDDNLLWVNLGDLGKPPTTEGWKNYGGDKVWPWPQDDWPALFDGLTWPPPSPFVGAAWQAVAAGDTVSMTTIPNDVYAVRPIREISLDETGTGATVRSILQPVENAAANAPAVAAWHVTQIPSDGATVLALGRPGEQNEPVWLSDADRAGDLEPFVEQIGVIRGDNEAAEQRRRVWSINNLGDRSGKAGIDGDILAGLSGSTLYVQYLAAAQGEGYINDAHRLQVYVNGPTNEAAGDPPSWTELEIAGPVGRGEAYSILTVRWLMAPAASDDLMDLAQQALAMVQADMVAQQANAREE